MRSIICMLTSLIVLCFNDPAMCRAQEGGVAVGVLGGCEIDLNADGRTDMVLLLDTSRGYELVALMKSGTASKAYHLKTLKSKMHASCHHGKQLKETDAGPGKKRGKTYPTNGTYLKLAQQEGASVAYFWAGDAFQEVWISD